jgi:hypothetical protein
MRVRGASPQSGEATTEGNGNRLLVRHSAMRDGGSLHPTENSNVRGTAENISRLWKTEEGDIHSLTVLILFVKE